MFYYFHKNCIIYVKLHFIVFVNGRDYEGQNLKISSGVEWGDFNKRRLYSYYNIEYIKNIL